MRKLFLLLLVSAACSRDPKVTYRTEPVTRGPISEVVSATGEVSALVTVTVGSQVSGTVSKLYVDFNSVVRKGQVLADLDPRLFAASVARAGAALAAAEADVERERAASAEADRVEQRTIDLAKRGLASHAELQTAEAGRASATAQLRAAQAKVLQARAERDTARTNLALSRIRSPIDGIVISRTVDVGQTVAAAFTAPTLFTIANDLSRMQVLAHVDEADVGKVQSGMRARFSVDAFPADDFEGTITEVRQAPTTIQNVVTYTAVIDAPNPEKKLRQGMTAQVAIVASERKDALRVANAALRYRPQGDGAGSDGAPGRQRAPAGGASAVGQARADVPAVAAAIPAREPREGGGGGARPAGREARVYRLEGGVPVPVRVATGITDGRQTEVVSGLTEGDVIVVGDTSPASGSSRPTGPRRGPF
jgi:HlyD family secretion protein